MTKTFEITITIDDQDDEHCGETILSWMQETLQDSELSAHDDDVCVEELVDDEETRS